MQILHAKHPLTHEVEEVELLAHYYGPGKSGVLFPDSRVYHFKDVTFIDDNEDD